MAELEKITGKVSQLRHTVDVSGTNNSTSTSQVAIFNIDGQPVSLGLSSAPILSEGDHVDVVGSVSRGILHARGYYNHTQEVWGSGSGLVYVLIAVFFSVLGVIFLFTMWIVALFLFAAVYWLLREWRSTKIIKEMLFEVDRNDERPKNIKVASKTGSQKREPPLTRDTL